MNRVIRNKIVVRHLTSKGIAQNQKELGEKMGYSSESAFSQVINEKVPEPKDFISKLKTFEPALNEEWLRTGEGEMLKVPATLTVFAPTDEERKEIGESVDIKAYPAEVVEEIKAEVAEEIKEEIMKESIVPLVPQEIANDRDVDIRAYIEHNSDELEHIDASKLFKRADFVEEVSGTSMWPTFNPNDKIFIKYLRDKARIIDGKTYYIETRCLPTMVRKVKIESDGRLRLIAKNPEFADIYIQEDDIKNIGKVVGMFRDTFGDQYDEIEAVRRKKDEQIDNLLLQNGGLIEQNGEALKIIRDLMKK